MLASDIKLPPGRIGLSRQYEHLVAEVDKRLRVRLRVEFRTTGGPWRKTMRHDQYAHRLDPGLRRLSSGSEPGIAGAEILPQGPGNRQRHRTRPPIGPRQLNAHVRCQRRRDRPHQRGHIWNRFDAKKIVQPRMQQALAQFLRAMVSHSSRWDEGYAQVFAPDAPNRATQEMIALAPGCTASLTMRISAD